MPRRYARKSSRVKKQRSKNKSWKSLKLFSKIQHTVKLLAFSVVTIFMTLAAIYVVYTFRLIRSPMAAGVGNVDLQSIKDKDVVALSFVVLEDNNDDASKVEELYFVLIGRSSNFLKVYKVPVKGVVDLPERYGEGEISKVYALGETGENGKGVILVNKTLEKIFAKRIDRYIITDKKTMDRLQSATGANELSGISEMVTLRNLPKLKDVVEVSKSGIESNLSMPEVWDLLKFAYTLSKNNLEQVELDPDSLLNTLTLDQELSEVFKSSSIVNENKRVLILNGAGVPKLGLTASRFLEKFGISVIEVGNASKTFDKSLIVTNSADSETLSTISYELDIENVLNPEVGIELVDGQPLTADVVVIVGIDYASSL